MAKRKFTWLDAVCIVLVLALIGGAVWYLRRDKGATEEKTYDVTFRYTQATEDEYDFFRLNDQIYFHLRVGKLGTVQTLSLVDTKSEVFNAATGEYEVMVDQLHKTVEMVVRAKGTVKDGKLLIDGQNLGIGATTYPQSDKARAVMTVWGIKEVEAE